VEEGEAEGEAEEAEEEEKERKRAKFIGRRRRRRWIDQNKRSERCLPPPHETSPFQVLRRRTGISYLRISVLFNLIDVEKTEKSPPPPPPRMLYTRTSFSR
jgi:hypothetical protein